MTVKGLLDGVGGASGPLLGQLVLVLLVLPLLPIAALFDVARATRKADHEQQCLEQSIAYCQHGHRVSLQGHWRCNCSYQWSGHAWSRCPADGTRASHIYCPCGAAVPNPLWDPSDL